MTDLAAHPGFEQAPLDRYRRSLAEGYRWLPLPAEHSHKLELSRLLIDLAATPLRPSPRGLPPAFARASTTSMAARDLVAAAGARITLVAGPGSGKSLLLRALTYACAAAALGEPPEALPLPENWRADPPLPLLLSAADCAPLPETWLARTLSRQQLDGALNPLLAQLSAGRCLVLIDSTAEAPDELLQALAALVAAYGANRFLVVGRSPALALATEPVGFESYQLRALEQGQIDTFIGRWTEELARVRNIPLDEGLRARAIRLQAALRASRELQAVATCAGTLVTCMLAHDEGLELPAQRSLLFARLARQQLIEFRTIVPLDSALQMLSVAAAALVSEATGPEQLAKINRADFARLLRDPDDSPTPAYTPTLPDACVRVGLLSADDQGMLQFAQPGVAQYLAASQLLGHPETVARALALRHQAAWRPVLVLVAVQLADAVRRDELAALLGGLLQAGQDGNKPCRHCLLLASAMLAEPFVAPQLPALLALVCEQLLGLLVSSVPLPERIEAGMLLGLLGDPRIASFAPDTIEVAAGPFLLGDDHPAYADEGPASFQELATFRIARHPVTNREYARFLAASSSYPHPRYWHDPAYTNPSQPVVGVSWHDAQNYCAWLTEQLRAAGLLAVGQLVRLPHELEWEKAASWDAASWAKRRFPWGDEWQPSRANTADDRGAWTTTPIGCYPDGVSPYGIHDLIGNVWEWTANEYVSYPGARTPFYEPEKYVLRGASCQSLASNARNTYRSRLPPDYWRHHLGFRIVISQPL